MENLDLIILLALLIRMFHDSIFGLQGLRDLKSLKKNGLTAKGIFIDKKDCETIEANSFFCRIPYQFTDEKNELHEVPISIFNWKYRTAKPGDEITVLYDKKNPSKSCPKEDIGRQINSCYFWFAVFSIYLILITIKAFFLEG